VRAGALHVVASPTPTTGAAPNTRARYHVAGDNPTSLTSQRGAATCVGVQGSHTPPPPPSEAGARDGARDGDGNGDDEEEEEEEEEEEDGDGDGDGTQRASSTTHLAASQWSS
jgi:hypothetical protein